MPVTNSGHAFNEFPRNGKDCTECAGTGRTVNAATGLATTECDECWGTGHELVPALRGNRPVRTVPEIVTSALERGYSPKREG